MRSSDDSDRGLLDRILDDALTSYCDVEPRPGIEARVIRRVREPRRLRIWVVLISVLGALILAIALEFRTVPPPPDGRSVATAQVPGPVATLAAEVDKPRARKHRIRIVHAVLELPRKSEFPTPTPLTPEEQAMVALASRSPREALLLANQGEITPITIPELQIKPLLSDGD